MSPSGRPGVTPDDYVCIMTRGHVGDYDVQRQMLAIKPYYLASSAAAVNWPLSKKSSWPTDLRPQKSTPATRRSAWPFRP